MKKYRVSIPTVIWYDYLIEAEDEAEAEDKAYDLYIDLPDDVLMTDGSEDNDILDAYVEEVE